jgi:hypothetical protein
VDTCPGPVHGIRSSTSGKAVLFLVRCLCSHAPTNTALDRWAEVSLLLRKPILQEEDMLYTVAAAEAGLIYTDEVSHPCLLLFAVSQAVKPTGTLGMHF